MTKQERTPRGHIFLDRGPTSKVLAVAHLDSVADPDHFWMNNEYIACPTIDNRLGAWVITHYLPVCCGIETDILLTDGEEYGASTAEEFVPPKGKQYNWMFSFDRMGVDVACYQYLGKELKAALEPYGLEAVSGSYSDIASLDDLGCRGMNFGCAMHNYHSINAYAIVPNLEYMLRAFLTFYGDHKEDAFPYTFQTRGTVTRYYGDEWSDEHISHLWSAAQSRQDWAERREKETATAMAANIAAEGMDNHFFDGMAPTTWWKKSGLSKTATSPSIFTSQCLDCGGFFTHKHLVWSGLMNGYYCHLCFMDYAQEKKYISPHWYTDACTKKATKETEDEHRARNNDYPAHGD